MGIAPIVLCQASIDGKEKKSTLVITEKQWKRQGDLHEKE
jgi:hypothetical protein